MVSPIFTKEPQFGLLKARKSGSSYDEHIVRAYVEAEIDAISKYSPDLILGDFRLTVGISSTLCKIPFVSILNGYWTNYYSEKHSAPESMLITELLGNQLSSLLFPRLRSLFLKWAVRPFNKECLRRGLKPYRNLFDVMSSRELNLICDLPEFTPLRMAPPHFHFVGPIIWEPNINPPYWLDKLDRERPVIYFSMGSTGFDKYFRKAVEIFSDTHYQILFTTGGMNLPNRRPANFFIEEYAPGIKLMEVSDILICHGGNGTIYQALSRGVPIIGIPTMHDQWFNMERVEALDVGIKLSEKKFHSKDLSSALGKILSNNTYKLNARKIQGAIQKYNAPQKAAELITGLLK